MATSRRVQAWLVAAIAQMPVPIHDGDQDPCQHGEEPHAVGEHSGPQSRQYAPPIPAMSTRGPIATKFTTAATTRTIFTTSPRYFAGDPVTHPPGRRVALLRGTDTASRSPRDGCDSPAMPGPSPSAQACLAEPRINLDCLL